MRPYGNQAGAVPSPFSASPALDLLNGLLRLNGMSNFRAPPSLGEEPTLSPQMVLSGATILPLLARSLLMSPLDSAPDFSSVIEVLKSIHGRANSNGNKASGPERIHRLLQDLETGLRDQSAAVDRLLGYNSSSKDTANESVIHALQQTLFLQCPKQGKTAGHFRVANNTGRSGEVHFRVYPSHTPEIGSTGAVMTFDPSSARLESKDAMIFRVLVDLSTVQEIVPDHLEFGADIHLNDELMLKLFMFIEVYDESMDAQSS